MNERSRRRRVVFGAAIVVAVLAAATGALRHVRGEDGGGSAVPGSAGRDAIRPLSTYAEELGSIDHQIRFLTKRAQRVTNDWVLLESLAELYLERARLTGCYDDYAHAETALAQAFATAPQGSGPLLVRADLNYALHRLDRIEPDLRTVEQHAISTPNTRVRVARLRADVDFQCGRYAQARAGYDRSMDLAPSPATACALALYHEKLGDFAAAERQLDRAASMLTARSPVFRAWMHLQRGLIALDRGQYADALAHYRRGDDTMPGWWLIAEHIAEVNALLGHPQAALELYEKVVAQTDNPEFMDAIATLHRAAGRAEQGVEWAQRAGARYRSLLAAFPAAAAGHALEHYLEVAPEPEVAVRLAEQNRDQRPGAEAHVLLARAYLQADRPADAARAIEAALATPWRTAELHATAAAVFAATGDAARAAEQRREALAINPRIDS